MIQKSYDESSSLYLIPTPIGNFDDITIRSLNILESVDELLCEDTRTTSLLLNHFNIHKKLVSCHEYNEEKMIKYVLNKLSNGYNLGLVTDQGSPVISDPGFIVARAVINEGYNVVSLPGATAFVPALSSSGINPSPFLFYGFLNSKNNKQINELKKLKNLEYSIIFYESVHRIKNTLKNIYNILGDRNICVGREISKIFEEYYRGKVSDIMNSIDNLKGEFVIVVEGNNNFVDYSSLEIIDHVNLYLDDLSIMEAIKRVAKERNVAKSVIYNEYHKRK